MRKVMMALRAQRQIIEPDRRKVTSPEAFNAHLDASISTLNKLRLEVDEPEAEPSASEPEEPELQLEREESGGKYRMERKGRNRSKA